MISFVVLAGSGLGLRDWVALFCRSLLLLPFFPSLMSCGAPLLGCFPPLRAPRRVSAWQEDGMCPAGGSWKLELLHSLRIRRFYAGYLVCMGVAGLLW